MPARKIGELLAVSGELKTLSREARRLAEIEQRLFEALPGALAEAARAKSLRAGTLILSADNAAVAAKLRQLAPRLLLHVRKWEPEVSSVRIEVQPAPQQGRRGKKSEKTLPGAAAITDFQSLAEGLRESPLKRAVTRMVQRHKRNVNSDR
jgi:hypothetical protein